MVVGYARPYKWQTIVSLILSVLLGLLATVRPILIRDGVDNAVVEGGDLQALWFAMVLLLTALVIEAIGQFIYIYATNDFKTYSTIF